MFRIFPLAAFLLTFATACSDDNDGPSPGPAGPTVVADSIPGGFVGKFTRFTQGEPFAGKVAKEWTDTAWQGDRLYQQIALYKPCTLRPSDLTSPDGEATIPAEAVRLRGVTYVKGDAKPCADSQTLPRTPAYVADALTSEPSTEASAAEPMKVWVTVDVPPQTLPGLYKGKITATSADGRDFILPIKFLVVNHRLPEVKNWSFHLDIWQFPFQLSSKTGVTPFSEQYFALLQPFYSLLADNGQKAVTTYIKDGAFGRGQTMIDWTRRADGSWQWDYSNFDRFVEFMFSLGIDRQINCLSPAGWRDEIGYTDLSDNTYKYMPLKVEDAKYGEIWLPFLADFRQHLQQKGWMDRAVLMLDEIPQARIKIILDMAQKDSPDWKVGLAGRAFDPALERRLYDYSTIYGYRRTATNCPVATFYTSCSQIAPNNYLTPATSPAEMTWMAWHALAGGYNGYLRWAFDYWMLSDPLDACDGLNTAGDFSMIYRSDNTPQAQPLSSIRWEMLRDGIQDYEKIRLLGCRQALRSLYPLFDDYGTAGLSAVAAGQSTLKQLSVKM